MNFIGTILFLISCLFSPLILADNVTAQTKELTSLQKKIKQITKKISRLKNEQDSLQIQLNVLDNEYAKSILQVKQLEITIKLEKKALEENQLQINAKKLTIDAQKHDLKQQIKIAHRMGSNQNLKLFLSQQDPTVSGRMLVYYEYLTNAKVEKIVTIDKDLQALNQLWKEQKNKNQTLNEKMGQRKLEQSQLVKTQSELKIVLAKIKKSYASKKTELKDFKRNEKNLKKLISSLSQTIDETPFQSQNNKTFAKLKGKLPWPLNGKVLKKFGSKRVAGSKLDGVLLAAKEGQNVRSISKGRIVYADWLRGYGLLAIIDHGKGYMSLYAYNQSLYKSVGDKVKAGTIIATAGHSGGQMKTALYFGIRKKGKPVNPEKWCR